MFGAYMQEVDVRVLYKTIIFHTHTHTILSQNFTNNFFFTPLAVHTQYFSCVAVTNRD